MTTRIEKGLYWDRAWKLVEGCTKVSPGCLNCWSERESNMRSKNPNPKISGRFEGVLSEGKWNGEIRERFDNIDLPATIKKPTRFCIWNDLFHDEVEYKWQYDVFWEIFKQEEHTFIILTKRPENMKAFIKKRFGNFPLKNVWLGVTAENQQQADERIPILLDIPAAVRFVSVEPMLSQVALDPFIEGNWLYCNGTGEGKYDFGKLQPCDSCHGIGSAAKLDWVICGEESGHHYRPLHPNWVRDLRDQCIETDTPFFLKQLWAMDKLVKMPELDGHVWDQMPSSR